MSDLSTSQTPGCTSTTNTHSEPIVWLESPEDARLDLIFALVKSGLTFVQVCDLTILDFDSFVRGCLVWKGVLPVEFESHPAWPRRYDFAPVLQYLAYWMRERHQKPFLLELLHDESGHALNPQWIKNSFAASMSETAHPPSASDITEMYITKHCYRTEGHGARR